jgi:hypothetical protein
VTEVSPEPTPSIDPSSGYSVSQPAETAESGYVGEPRLGSTTAGYDTGTTGYDTGTSSGPTPAPGTDYDAEATTTPSTGYDAEATTTPSTGYDAEATTEPTSGSGYDAGAGADVSTGYDAGVTAESATVASSEPASSGAAEQPAAASSAAPAGWYADPSGRYELRYWDGSQWTEHVSRAGQQYTDPPVA